MELELQKKILDSPKMYQHLKEHSQFVKQLNRDSSFYAEFERIMKELYHDRVTDKIGDAIDQLDVISGVLSALK